MRQKGNGPWLRSTDESEILRLLLEFMPCRLFSFNNQQSTVRGYLAAIKFFHRLYFGWEPPTSHCMIVAAGRGVDRIWGASNQKVQVRLPLTWAALASGYLTVTNHFNNGGNVMWLGLALSHFMLCHASELFAYASGLVHPEICLTRACLTFSLGGVQVSLQERATADAVAVRFVASKADQNRKGCTITRVRAIARKGTDGTPVGAFEAIVKLLDLHPSLPRRRPVDDEEHAHGMGGCD